MTKRKHRRVEDPAAGQEHVATRTVLTRPARGRTAMCCPPPLLPPRVGQGYSDGWLPLVRKASVLQVLKWASDYAFHLLDVLDDPEGRQVRGGAWLNKSVSPPLSSWQIMENGEIRRTLIHPETVCVSVRLANFLHKNFCPRWTRLPSQGMPS